MQIIFIFFLILFGAAGCWLIVVGW